MSFSKWTTGAIAAAPWLLVGFTLASNVHADPLAKSTLTVAFAIEAEQPTAEAATQRPDTHAGDSDRVSAKLRADARRELDAVMADNARMLLNAGAKTTADD